MSVYYPHITFFNVILMCFEGSWTIYSMTNINNSKSQTDKMRESWRVIFIQYMLWQKPEMYMN